MRTIRKIILGGALSFLPFIASAQTFKNIVVSILEIIGSYLMPVLLAAALAYFIWGVVEFIQAADNAEKRKQGKERILWGIFALFAMVAYLGLVNIFSSGFFNTSSTILPQFFTS